MAKHPDRRATTLSISLTPELSGAVAERVRSGLYTSASELIREALRMLLRAEAADQVARTAPAADSAASRLAAAADLMELGAAVRENRLGRTNPHPDDAAVRARLDALAGALETGPGLRVSPERLRKLKRDG